MAGLGWQELLIIFVILLLVFGRHAAAGALSALGQSVRGFKKGLAEDSADKLPRDDRKGDGIARESGDLTPRDAVARTYGQRGLRVTDVSHRRAAWWPPVAHVAGGH